MGSPTFASPVAILLATISRHDDALSWACARITQHWGPIALRSATFNFDETDYYTEEMGPGLGKTFVVIDAPGDSAGLTDWKLLTNQWEHEYAALGLHGESRPLNLDPGYVTPAKLVLASTKDYAHRIYLRDGIFAEITLMYRGGRWQHHDFTFPDYRRADIQAFMEQARQHAKRLGKAMLP